MFFRACIYRYWSQTESELCRLIFWSIIAKCYILFVSDQSSWSLYTHRIPPRRPLQSRGICHSQSRKVAKTVAIFKRLRHSTIFSRKKPTLNISFFWTCGSCSISRIINVWLFGWKLVYTMYCSPGKEKKKYCLFSRWLLQLIFKILQGS